MTPPKSTVSRVILRVLQSQKQELEKSIKTAKANVAYYITYLDMVDDGHRVFTCSHDDLGNVPDGRNTTQQVFPSTVATMLFKSWQHDEDFMKTYSYTTWYQLEHHRAHEKVNQGRGDFSADIYQTFLAIDLKRKVSIAYF